MGKSPTLTILTTTYNRSHLLGRCFESLCNQISKDFEWLIIDDGSTDDTEAVVQQYKKTAGFPIRYFRKENGGKHTALNFSHPYIRGQYVLMLDDDDILVPDAVEIVLNDWNKYAPNKKIACLSYQRGNVGTHKPLVDWSCDQPVVSNTIDFRVNKGLSGDCAEVLRSSVFKEFPAPVFENEKFLPEDFLWIPSAFEYDTVYIRKVIYLCEYRPDGLTKAGKKNQLKNPLGGLYTCNLYFRKGIGTITQFKKGILYNCFALSAGRYCYHLKKANNILLCVVTLPIALPFYLYWKIS